MNKVLQSTGLSFRDTAALRSIALYEVAKALIVLAAGGVTLFLLRHDLEGATRHALGHLHLDPAGRLSIAILHMALRLQGFDPRWIALGSILYATIRLSESYGLWHGKAWGEWIGALSGAIYMPLEIRELFEGVTSVRLGLLLANLAIVGFLAWHLWYRKRIDATALDALGTQQVSPPPEIRSAVEQD